MDESSVKHGVYEFLQVSNYSAMVRSFTEIFSFGRGLLFSGPKCPGKEIDTRVNRQFYIAF